MTYFMVRSNLVACAFEWGKLLESHLMGGKLAVNDQIDNVHVYKKKLNPGDCLPLPPGLYT